MPAASVSASSPGPDIEIRENPFTGDGPWDAVVVGAGFAGAVAAERLATLRGMRVLVMEKRPHTGGNCHDEVHSSGIIVKRYGPHIFHTRSPRVCDYLEGFTSFNTYRHKVVAFHRGRYFPIPINRDTVNAFFGTAFETPDQVRAFLEKKAEPVDEVLNSRDVVVSRFGRQLYEAFIEGYTKKQWDRFPHELDRSVLERLPVRYDCNPYYFDDPWQGMPEGGYGRLFDRLLSNPLVTVATGVDFFEVRDRLEWKVLVYTGPLDRYFDYRFGRLQYRGIDFEFQELDSPDFQPNSVVNHPAADEIFSRVTEFKKFYPETQAQFPSTVICRETFCWDGEPAYPLMDSENIGLAGRYREMASTCDGVLFLGRLGTYSYLNMDQVVLRSLEGVDSLFQAPDGCFRRTER